MAYDFQKLADVELMEEVPDGASAFVAVDGVVKRVPGSGLGGGGWFVVTASVDESENIIVDHYRDDIAAAFENGKMPIVKMTYDGETNIMNMVSITQYVANFICVILSGNQNVSDVRLQQINIGKENVSYSMRNIIGK